MRNIDPVVIAEIIKEITSTFLLIELQFASTYYYTDRDVSIFYGGHKYEPLAFKPGSLVYAANMSVDRVTIDVDNVSLWLSAILLGEDVRNKTSILSFGCMGENVVQWDEDVVWSSEADTAKWYQNYYSIIGIVELFRGFIGDWELSEIKAKITQVNELIFWKKKTLRICQATCPWVFVNDGSGDCKYNGVETWCDQSYNRCFALGNNLNFGGFRFLPAVSEKQIWWGRLPDEV
ncbi:MAG: hypothetical protein Q7I98_07985 [Erysipelotrichaceae bacterium]|nr:hypothetical protein [Erysipelotrichaceae bacterium]